MTLSLNWTSFFVTISFAFTTSAFAADVFVGPESKCSGDGVSWASCANWGNLNFKRGNTYYLMDGTYPGKTLSTSPDPSGTSSIIIRKATSEFQGGGSLPANVSLSGQAIFTSNFIIDTSYWTLDGVKGSWSDRPEDYGFKFADGITYNLFVSKYNGDISNLTFSHIAAKAPSVDKEKPFFRVYTQLKQVDNITLSHSLLDGYQAGMQSSGMGSETNDNWIFEHNVALRGYSREDGTLHFHGEWLNADGKDLNNLTVRYNLFKDADGGMSGTIFANNSDINNAEIYGNVFDHVDVGNGIISESTGAGGMNNSLIYNNTFLNVAGNKRWIGGDGNRGSGNVAKNNLIYKMAGTVGTGFTNDYNSYFDTTNTPSKATEQKGSGNPFSNLSTYELSAQTYITDSAVPAKYRTDRFGIIGTRPGAVQSSASSPAATPSAPRNLRVP